MALQGFDSNYYLGVKLAALRAELPGWQDKTVNDLETILLEGYGLTAEAHYRLYGYAEGLAPNAYFQADEYVEAKALHLVRSGLYGDLDAARASFTAAWQGDPYEHYLQHGAGEGINPSNAFDSSNYLDDKLAALQSSSPELYGSWSQADVAATFAVVVAIPVPEGERVYSAGEEPTLAIAEILALGGAPNVYRLADTLANLLSADPALLGGALSYGLTDQPGADLGLLDQDGLIFVEEAENYARGKWQYDADTYILDDQHAAWPYSAVVYIESTFPNGDVFAGSGVVVGDNDVLTVSHLVYDPASGGVASRVVVSPGRDGDSTPYGQFVAGQIDYLPSDLNSNGLLSLNEAARDVALLGFSTALATGTGSFSLGFDEPSGYFNLSGFPGNSRDASGPRMTNDYGYAVDLATASVFEYHTLESNPGNSGGPLWYQDENGGIIVAGLASTTSWAVDLTGTAEQILAWIDGNNALLGQGRTMLATDGFSAADESGAGLELSGVATGIDGAELAVV